MNTPPAFFTSIPKCGKNIIYSFFAGLGYQRYSFKNSEYNLLSNLDVCAEYPGRDHYVNRNLHQRCSTHEREALRRAFLEECASLPAQTVSHRHLHADDVVPEIVNLGIKPIFVYRDPRACLISAAHYALKGAPDHVAEPLKGLTLEETALALLNGHDRLVPFDVWYDAYRGLLEIPGVISVRFEDLIGPQGGGSEQQQYDAFSRILDQIGVVVLSDVLARATDKAFNRKAGTFRSGQISGWQSEFTPRLAEEFKRRAGYLVPAWGYEP